MIEFSKIVLTHAEKKAFRKFRFSNTALLSQSEFNLLHQANLVSPDHPTRDQRAQLVFDGICRLTELGEALKDFRRKCFWKEFWSWARYSITTAIAVAAFIRSFL